MNQPDHFSAYLHCYISAGDLQHLMQHAYEFEASAHPTESRPFLVLLPLRNYYVDMGGAEGAAVRITAVGEGLL